MTTNKPEVRVFRPSAQAGCPAMRIVFPSDRVSQVNKYVRLSDYEALQAENEKLRAAMIEAKSYIDHYMYGGSSYREPAAKAIAIIDAAIQGTSHDD